MPAMSFFSVSKLERVVLKCPFFLFFSSSFSQNLNTQTTGLYTQSTMLDTLGRNIFVKTQYMHQQQNMHIKTSTLSVKNTEKRYINQIQNVNKSK